MTASSTHRDMRSHVDVLGWIFIALGFFAAASSLFVLLLFFGIGVGSDDPTATPILFGLGAGVFMFVLAVAAVDVLGGWALLKRKTWGRGLGIVLSALSLFSFPIGTIVGIYGLWVLLQPETRALFGSAAHDAASREGQPDLG